MALHRRYYVIVHGQQIPLTTGNRSLLVPVQMAEHDGLHVLGVDTALEQGLIDGLRNAVRHPFLRVLLYDEWVRGYITTQAQVEDEVSARWDVAQGERERWAYADFAGRRVLDKEMHGQVHRPSFES